MTDYNSVYDFALKNGCTAVFDEPLSAHTSFKIGGNAKLFVVPESDEALAVLLKYCADGNIRTLIIGNGSNMLVSDDGIDAVVILMCRESSGVSCSDGGVVECDAGVSLSKVCRFALDNSLTGLEFAYGIPGTLGGAVYMNAGAYGGEIKDVIIKCDCLTPDGQKKTFTADEMKLGYRKSVFSQNGCVITKVYLKLNSGDYDKIKAEMTDILNRRKLKQPLEYPSAGSVFKRPEGHFAGALIEQCNLKGVSVGGAQVSQKHAGFIINTGGATALDVMTLVKLIQDKVLSETGVLLEPEIKIFN